VKKGSDSGDDRPADNGDNRRVSVSPAGGKSSVLSSPRLALLLAAIAAGVALHPSRAQAQWWSRGPADFEECADIAEKAATREAKAAALVECNAKFAGRRKPGGGYTYFDFMQNRNFDIAGPNPTPQEQKLIDEQYTAWLDEQRRSRIAAAFAARQLQQTALKIETEKAPQITASIGKPRATAGDAKRSKAAECSRQSFSCEWPRLSEGIHDLKKLLFGPSPSKPGRRHHDFLPLAATRGGIGASHKRNFKGWRDCICRAAR
jgi:hypothetical protein